MAFATGETAQAALRAGGAFQPPGRGQLPVFGCRTEERVVTGCWEE